MKKLCDCCGYKGTDVTVKAAIITDMWIKVLFNVQKHWKQLH